MSLSPNQCLAVSANVYRARLALRSVGNANSSRTLDGECTGEDDVRRRASDSPARPAPSRPGTVSDAPFWHGPRLRPAFVAQVLGQVLMDDRAQGLSRAASAYRGAAAQIAPGAFFHDDV
jgi:hypothetical protein